MWGCHEISRSGAADRLGVLPVFCSFSSIMDRGANGYIWPTVVTELNDIDQANLYRKYCTNSLVIVFGLPHTHYSTFLDRALLYPTTKCCFCCAGESVQWVAEQQRWWRRRNKRSGGFSFLLWALCILSELVSDLKASFSTPPWD